MDNTEHTENTSKPWLWKPGQSGNPGGRPKRKYITDALKECLESNPEELRKMAQAAIREALNGNIRAFQEIADRTEGKVADIHKIEGEVLITPNMRVLAAREMLEIKEEEAKL